MLVLQGSKAVCQTFIYQISEIKKLKMKNDQKVIHKRYKIADLGQTKLGNKVIGSQKGNKATNKIFAVNKSRKNGKSKREKIRIGEKK